ncbi:MAG: phosphoribosylglycinamide formyltransferase [Hormoscilla sp. GM102CHS1]|nr:phosphoribosylglycinamide formyltransferase [Hormoscilla sp. GM102CHS1]
MSDSLATDRTPSLISPDMLPYQSRTTGPLKLGVLASGNGSNFEAMIEAIASGQLHGQVQVVIYNNPGAKVAARAERWGVPAILLNHREYDRREYLDAAIVEVLQGYEVEWVVMAGWMRIVTPVLLDAFENRAINIHPSLLPSFPGVRAIEQALAAGVKITGCTVHLVVPEVDAGPILMQAAVPVMPDDTPESLHARVQVMEHRILPRAIALAASRTSS